MLLCYRDSVQQERDPSLAGLQPLKRCPPGVLSCPLRPWLDCCTSATPGLLTRGTKPSPAHWRTMLSVRVRMGGLGHTAQEQGRPHPVEGQCGGIRCKEARGCSLGSEALKPSAVGPCPGEVPPHPISAMADSFLCVLQMRKRELGWVGVGGLCSALSHSWPCGLGHGSPGLKSCPCPC